MCLGAVHLPSLRLGICGINMSLCSLPYEEERIHENGHVITEKSLFKIQVCGSIDLLDPRTARPLASPEEDVSQFRGL